MNEEQRMRSEQYAKNFGAKEFLRFGCAYMTLQMVGLALGMAFHNAGITIIFIVISHGILWFAPNWQPAYTIVHKIMGQQDLPSTLPKSQKKWWHYIPFVIKIIILLVTLRLGLQLLFQ